MSIELPSIDPDIVALFDAFARCDAPIGNYYGTPCLVRFEGRWYMALGTSKGANFVRVSEAFAAAWLAEFDSTEAQTTCVGEYFFGQRDSPWTDRDVMDGPLDDDEKVAQEQTIQKLATAIAVHEVDHD